MQRRSKQVVDRFPHEGAEATNANHQRRHEMYFKAIVWTHVATHWWEIARTVQLWWSALSAAIRIIRKVRCEKV